MEINQIKNLNFVVNKRKGTIELFIFNLNKEEPLVVTAETTVLRDVRVRKL